MKPDKRLPRPTQIRFELDLLDLHASHPKRYPFLLESAAYGTALGRYDILFGFPEKSLRLDSEYQLTGSKADGSSGFLSAFDSEWSKGGNPGSSGSQGPFHGGWFVFLGYELAAEIEPRLDLIPMTNQPVAIAVRIPVAIVRDHERSCAWIVTEPGFESAIDKIQHDIAEVAQAQPVAGNMIVHGSLQEEPADKFLHAVQRAKEYIAAGDIFQANLSREWSARLAQGIRPSDLYRHLRRSNPAPFAGLAVFEEMSVISSSPERLLRSRDGGVETRPIAGTRPRSPDLNSDEPRRSELLSHPKERAEHIMLIDLERNDLGRICSPGTVKVDEFMVVESYSHVHHIVSNVSGQLLDGMTPGDTIRAVFPGGTITGCPKVRCMEIINELEGRPRGAYTGAMGYFNHDGSGDLNILIRTMTTVGDELSFATGSGIVADSNPTQELEETRAKAKGLLLALENQH
jgi:anthranilate synthase component 1